MSNFKIVSFAALTLVSSSLTMAQTPEKSKKLQYHYENIAIPQASADEPIRQEFSLELADRYLEQGALAWTKQRKCISCHTNGLYLFSRPELSGELGPPSSESRDFFVKELRKLKAMDREKLLKGIRPTQVAYIAAGLAEWDRHISKTLSPQTDEALRFMLSLQAKDGSWGNADCWPPLESSNFQGATVAARALSSAPGWLDGLKDETLQSGVERLKAYLQNTEPAHDYGRLIFLWTAARYPDLISDEKKQALIEMVMQHQRPDGGWSIRTFAAPEAWGRGNRAKKLREETEFDKTANAWKNPASDGHQTGLAILVLRENGVPANDPRIQKGIQWLLKNQRESGRWWTRSLNTDRWHFITYSGTFYPLQALKQCNVLPTLKQTTAR
ncbi:prenyltransferase/squalene oxidase repeat-containing protein [Gimesia aquarii]|uniref:Prenyltransferase and squalene oxidase repeat protein n=1 Tax=Gimesia aquarii TaxID=2527964 RepID=A0A517X2C7_9PLAN|nr:prenyltransferase/squalene oxidase repeat-containing protein [Gimesia aquarii]QDU11663.1 Prenyltransferase and squalene oxidase repeat protein [Gimesia aquarii]